MGLKAKGIGMLSILILLTLVVIPVMAKGRIVPPIQNPLPAHSGDVGTTELYVIAFIIIIVILIIRKLLSSRR